MNAIQHVTKRKLERLNDHITKYDGAKEKVAACVKKVKENHPEVLETKQALIKEVKELINAAAKNGFDLKSCSSLGRMDMTTIIRFLSQAEYDPSISEAQIRGWKAQVDSSIEIQGRILVYAKFFGQLCTEWTESNDKTHNAHRKSSEGDLGQLKVQDESDTEMVSSPTSSSASTSSYVAVGRKEMQEQREQWEQYAFTACPKDQFVIDTFLKNLFASTHQSKKLTRTPLHELQLAMGRFDEAEPRRFDQSIVVQCIDGLLDVDFFAGGSKKRQELLDMKSRLLILDEIADVLNMDLDLIDTWTWEGPLRLQTRRQLNGKYRVYYDEEVHQAIFLQFIGMKWGVLMKQAFVKFFHSGSWTQAPYRAIDKLSKQRRDYFLGSRAARCNNKSVRNERRRLFESEFFMLQLPDDMDGRFGTSSYVEDAENRNDWPSSEQSTTSRRHLHPAEKKDLLHRLVTTEMLVQTAVYGECSILQSDFKYFGGSIPHDTIFAVLKFLGVKGKWLSFFRRFLEPQVYWEDEPSELRQRKRGTPMNHALSDAFGEAILFCLDFAVSKATKGADLFRFHDDLWFFGQEEVVISAWTAMQDFASMVGLELNMQKSGAAQVFADPEKRRPLPQSLPQGDVTFGLLKLDTTTASWIVDDAKVSEHITELGHQLRACDSVFAWIQAWNSYACRFLAANLGRPAKCFGTAHVASILKTFALVQKSLFGADGSAHAHLRAMLASPNRHLLSSDFDISTIPDGFFYFPTPAGGLDLQNPFIKPHAMISQLPQEPLSLITQAFDQDADDYEQAKTRFEADGGGGGPHRGFAMPHNADVYTPLPDEPFMPLEEYTRFREETSAHLAVAYEGLMSVPSMEEVHASAGVREALGKRWGQMSTYEKWVAELYGQEVVEGFGGLRFAEEEMLPLGMVESLRGERVRWIA